ncbi:hypothetical protein DX927_16600 [Bacillus swezeyi]|uniref:Uncharacterized protein n=1 Tax=Bacillus swezeyi TaxID=1925020 RepID=A0A5M8RQ25_9BACI|nr:hypothetical protein DX927_16600 [Bacillus swezeyi]
MFSIFYFPPLCFVMYDGLKANRKTVLRILRCADSAVTGWKLPIKSYIGNKMKKVHPNKNG